MMEKISLNKASNTTASGNNTMDKKSKALLFYQYLPPWRIDVFNEMGKSYDLTIVFTNAETEGFTYNRAELLSKLKGIKTVFLNNGFKIGSRPLRIGITKLLNRLKPDIVFSHEYSPVSILLAFYHKTGIYKYRYYLTTSDNLQIAQSVPKLKAIARSFVLKNSDGLIVYSQSVKEWYTQHFKNLEVEICPNIQKSSSLLAYSEFFPSIVAKYKNKFSLQNDNIVLYIGRITEAKGLDLLLKAFAKSNHKDYKLVIVGSGKQEDFLKQLASDLHISNDIIFAGSYSGSDLYAWYSIANFFILPSRYEPFGAVVNEALVYGCPVLASKYIGAIDFIDSSNGNIFDPYDESEFIELLNESYIKYKNRNSLERSDLMIYSFEEYIKCLCNKYLYR